MLCSTSQGVIVPIPFSLFSLSLRVYFILLLLPQCEEALIYKNYLFQFSLQIIFLEIFFFWILWSRRIWWAISDLWIWVLLLGLNQEKGYVLLLLNLSSIGVLIFLLLLLGGFHLLFYMLRSLWIVRGRLFWAWKIEVLGFVLKPWMNLTMAMGYLVCRNSWWLWLNSVKDWHCKNVVILCWGVIFGIFSFFPKNG